MYLHFSLMDFLLSFGHNDFYCTEDLFLFKHNAKNICHLFLPYGREKNYEQQGCKLSLTTHRRRL